MQTKPTAQWGGYTRQGGIDNPATIRMLEVETSLTRTLIASDGLHTSLDGVYQIDRLSASAFALLLRISRLEGVFNSKQPLGELPYENVDLQELNAMWLVEPLWTNSHSYSSADVLKVEVTHRGLMLLIRKAKCLGFGFK